MTWVKGPFDWTVTSFGALEFCLNPRFEPDTILSNDHLRISYAGSGMCDRSGLIFHHALSSAKMRHSGHAGSDGAPQNGSEFSDLVSEARGRFCHTFENMKSLRDFNGAVLFVRWKRLGHPDHRFPSAFEGENNDRLAELLASFFPSRDFFLLNVTSKILKLEKEPISDPILHLQRSGNVFSCKLAERNGWNGKPENQFRGDDFSWRVVLHKVVSELGPSTLGDECLDAA